MNFLKVKILLFFFLPVFSTGLFSSEIKDLKERISSQESEMSTIEADIKKLRSSLRELSEIEKNMTVKLDRLDSEISAKRFRVAGVRKEIEEVGRQISAGEREIKEKEMEKAGLAEDFGCLARAYYYRFSRSRRRSWVSSVFGSPRPDDFRLAYMLRQPAEEYIRTGKKIDEKITRTRRLQEKNLQLAGLKGELASIQSEALEKRKEQVSILGQIREQHRNRRERVEKKEEEKRQLKELIESLRYRAESLEILNELAEDFTKGRGRLPWPLKGEVVSLFGRRRHPTLDTYLYNRGIEIEPGGVTEVLCVAGGEVVYSGTFRGKGKMVVIDHGNNYYTIYGGLKEIASREGELKEPLDPLGSAAGPVYFELGRGSEPRDPLEWLK